MKTEFNDQRSEVRGQESAVGICGSVLECGDSSPLSVRVGLPDSRKRRSSGAVETLARHFALWGLFLAATGAVPAQNFSIDWHTIDGGGGTSTGGVYSVSGTIGQPDAGPVMTGGTFSLQGGFWALPVAVQLTNAPTLIIALAAPGFALISWSPNIPGYVLQERSGLSSVTWANSPSGSTNPIVVPTTLPLKFYRLLKP